MTTTPSTTKAAARRGTAAPKTKWGDREGRRRDILDAARRQMAAGGYLALNMRDIARGAGVSPGTLYSYFATKEEIFATLYAEAIEAHNERIVPLCDRATDLESLLVDLATAYLDLYGSYGRYFTMWSALLAEGDGAKGPLPPELGTALREATFRHGDVVRSALRRVAAAEGRSLVDEPKVMPFLWAVMNGIGDHVTSDRRHLSALTSDDLIRYAARTLAAGLTAPADPPAV